MKEIERKAIQFVVWERGAESLTDVIELSGGTTEELFNVFRDCWPQYMKGKFAVSIRKVHYFTDGNFKRFGTIIR